MFGFDLHDVKETLQRVLDGQTRAWAGAAFLILALVAIEYDEFVAPSVGRLSDAWGSIAVDFGKKLSSFTL